MLDSIRSNLDLVFNDRMELAVRGKRTGGSEDDKENLPQWVEDAEKKGRA